MTRPSGLGRGLGSLIPTEPIQPDGEATFQMIAVSAIRANPYQPRNAFDEESLAGLARSIAELGVLQPLLVRHEGNEFELIAGERRLRAAQLAGLERVPVLLRDADDKGSLEEALVENLHRQDLNALEEAAAYRQLQEEFGLNQTEIAERVGRSRSAVANTLRLLGLPAHVQRMVIDGTLSAGHARALLALDDEEQILALAERVVDDDLSVRQIEALVRTPPDSSSSATKKRSGAGTSRNPAVLELEELLSGRLSTSVRVALGRKRGKITIDYADLDDLERIFHIINGTG
ncbi:MAG: ParB/RepB/Spo0J family partition protein [Acidimicrobiia bacterium]|nr:ParB/RepB/Spo0J family partition protein [Acidimicrobiia bacterium]